MYPDRLSQGLPVDQKLKPLRMGRLFWKFFFVLLLAQIVSVLGVGLLISWHNREYANDVHREQRFENTLPRVAESAPEYVPSFRFATPRRARPGAASALAQSSSA